ncbi:MAG: amidase family protein [Tepidisphaeraceae bacterium]
MQVHLTAPSARSRRARSFIVVATSAATFIVLGISQPASAVWDPVEKTISDFQAALAAHTTTVAEAAQTYVDRINQYNTGRDIPGVGFRVGLNAVAEVNPNWQTEAAAIDQLIANGATTAQYPLLGVPVLVKNSYDAVGMATSNGVSVLNKDVNPFHPSTAGATTLKPTKDSFSVAQLRAAAP